MDSNGDGASLPPNFLLTPHQQNLLYAALNANKQQPNATSAPNALSLSPSSFQSSPMQNTNGGGVQDSPFLDNYDPDFVDSSFDFSFAGGDQGIMVGDMPGGGQSDSAENEGHDKRSHPDDDDDESSPGNDSKRRESTDKIAKKPGRKPLTSEPTSKRKAQNRAAQRAFRERKEKHLKDLETKVEELEKASDDASHENSKLRAQIDRISSELNQYKQRLAVVTNKQPTQRDKMSFNNAALNSISDVNFQFEFPKFGALPGPPVTKQSSPSAPQSVSSPQNGSKRSPASFVSDGKSPQSGRQSLSDVGHKDGMSSFANFFNPSSISNSTRTGSRASVDSVPFSVAAATSSPSASSNSNVGGPSSSCGTSPEPFTQSPLGFKPMETLTTIGEEQPTTATAAEPFAQFANVNMDNSNLDWLVQQNGGQFDPQLFGDYRESQDNVLTNPSFDDFFFNDSLDADFFTPYNANPVASKKPNLIAEIDAKQNAVEDDMAEKKAMNCNKLWEKLQECPSAQSGDFDLDGLCSELTKKAKCSGSGPVVAEKDFDVILKKYMGKDVSTDCVANKLGISVTTEQSNGITKP